MAFVLLTRSPFSEAQVQRLALERANVPVELRGEMRTGLFGVEPQEDAALELWVDEGLLKRAQQVLDELLRPVAEGPERDCVNCGAPNPSHFQVCWKCQAQVADGAPAEVLPETPAPSEPARPFPKSTAVLVGLVVVLTVALLAVLRVPRYVEPSGVTFREDGRCLAERRGGVVRARYCDDDEDGHSERDESFDERGHLTSRQFDENENGAFERVDTFDEAGALMQQSMDSNDDGRVDLVREFHPGGSVYETSYAEGQTPALTVFRDGGVVGRFRPSGAGWVPSRGAD